MSKEILAFVAIFTGFMAVAVYLLCCNAMWREKERLGAILFGLLAIVVSCILVSMLIIAVERGGL